MNWKNYLRSNSVVAGGGSDEVVTVSSIDSRKVKPGAVFVAMKGGSRERQSYVDRR